MRETVKEPHSGFGWSQRHGVAEPVLLSFLFPENGSLDQEA